MRRLIRNRAIWLLIASFAILCTCFAQQPSSSAPSASADETATASDQTASFSGYVRTSAGVGVPGAQVRITNTDLQKSWATWTDANGKFSLPALPLGHYDIAATQLGFVESSNQFTLTSFNNEKPSLITLNVATLAQLNAPPAANPVSPTGTSAANGRGGNAPAGAPGATSADNTNPATNPNAANNTTAASGNGNGGAGRARGGSGRGGNGGGFGGRGGQGQGAANANNQGGQNGQNPNAFSQTDLTGLSSSGDQTQIGAGDQSSADLALGGATGNTADAMVLQGGTGQGATFGGPGGPGGFGPGGIGGIGGPGLGGDIGFGTPGDAGAFTGAGGGAVGAGFGGGPGGGGPGGGFGGGGGRGGPGGGGPGGGGGGGFGGGGGGGGGRGGRGGGGGGAFAGGRGGRGGAGATRLFRQRANRYRYAFYDTYNNSGLNARPDTFNPPSEQVKKAFTYNENFGADVQGPFKIPHIYDGTGRTNVFLNYEHRTNYSAANNESIVPDANERVGNFCGVSGITGFFNPYNPSGSPLPCDLRTATNPQTGTGTFAIDGAAAALLNPSYIPLPNLTTPTSQGYNYLLQLRTPSNTDIVNARLMHTINSKFNLTGVYAANLGSSKSVGSFPSTIGNTSTLGQSITLTLNHNRSSRIVERTNASWSRSRSQLASATENGANIESEFGIEGASPLAVNFGLPGISLQGASSLSEPVPSLTRNQTLLLSDTLSIYKTKHTITLGGQVRDVDLNNVNSPNPRGSFSYTGGYTCGSGFSVTTLSAQLNNGQPCDKALVSGTVTTVQLPSAQSAAYDFADFLIGLPFTARAAYGTPENYYLRSWGFAAYAQDDWRLTKTFTLQYGVRWDATKPTLEKYNHISNLVPEFNSVGALAGVSVVTPSTPGTPRSLVNGAYKNFGPRTGFAWVTPLKKHRTVVRGGYSIFYNVNAFTSLVRDFTFQSPFATSFSVNNSAADFFTTENGLLAPSSSGITVPNTYAVDPNYKPYRAQTWNIGTETDLSRNWVLDLQYTGTAGKNLDILRSPNRAKLGTNPALTATSLVVPIATQFTYDTSGATSLYNGLQVRVLHRYTHGISFQGQWTYSKSIDDASDVGGGGLVEPIDGDLASLRGLSSFDDRHNVRGTATYELPFGQRYRFANHGWTNKLFGDWRLLNTVTWRTGTPLNLVLNSDPSGTGIPSSSAFPNVTGNPNKGICGGGFTNFFNAAVFAVPANGTYGDGRKGMVEGPCSLTWNASMNKAFRVGNTDDQRRGEIEWDVTNLTNHVNYAGVSTTVNGGTELGRVTSAGGMRTMSLTLRLNF